MELFGASSREDAMLCSVLSRFALPCVAFVLVVNEILDLCPRRLLAHELPFIARQDKTPMDMQDKRQVTD